MKQLTKIPQKLFSLCVIVWLSITISYAQQQAQSLARSTPEAEGISSKGILRFLDAVASGKNELHSFVIVRHGKIVSEGWWKPYEKDLKHVMFSVSKSFTSTAVGIAAAENKLKITDKVYSFFPNSLPDTLGAYMKDMTVRDLLMMSTGMDTDPLFKARSASNWPKAFLSSTVEHDPGIVFRYNNMATFMLSAIVQKATGEKLFDYLRPRLFEPLGISNVTWDETPEGYSFGAIGLRIQSEDMAKFGQLLLQRGKWNGKQLVPEAWIAEATSFKIESSDPGNKNPKELNDWAQGYCYQFWRCRNNAYRADGLGGQFIIVLPDKDAVIVLTASATNTQEELNLVWDNLLPAIGDKRLPEDKNLTEELARRIAALSTSTQQPSASTNSKLASRISGKKIELKENANGIKSLTISLNNTDMQMQIERDSERHSIVAGTDSWKRGVSKLNTLAGPPRQSQNPSVQFASTYSWNDPNTLQLTTKFVEESIWSEQMIFRFAEDGADTTVQIELKARQGLGAAQPVMLEGRISHD